MDKKNLYIVDGSSYEFRAYFASPPMSTSSGQPTNALYVFTRMLLALVHNQRPDALIVVFDAPGKKFRHELYEEYKAQRAIPPDDFKAQFPWFPRIVEAFGIPSYVVPHYEADDVIATLCRKAQADDWYVTIVSGDKDLMQLIRDGAVRMMDTMSKPPKIFDEACVMERFQVEPARVADVLALSGDTADNIPGAKGIGEKTAGKLIVEYGSLENLMACASDIKAKARRENLLAFAEHAALSKKLVSLVDDIDLEVRYGHFQPSEEAVLSLFAELEFQKMIREVLPDYKGAIPTRKPNQKSTKSCSVEQSSSFSSNGESIAKGQLSLFAAPQESGDAGAEANAMDGAVAVEEVAGNAVHWCDSSLVINQEALSRLEEKLRGGCRFALRPFWEDLRPTHARLVGLACAVDGECCYIPLKHHDLTCMTELNAEQVQKCLQTYLSDPAKEKVIYDFKPFSQYLNREHIAFHRDSFFDIKLAAYLWHPEKDERETAVLAPEVLGESVDSLEGETELLGKGKNAMRPSELPVLRAARTVGRWAQADLAIAEKLKEILKRNDLFDLYSMLELPLSEILGEMESTGIEIDRNWLSQLKTMFEAQLKELEEKIWHIADAEFNILSPKQVGEVLYEKLGYAPKHKKSREHGLSTDQETLESLAEQGPLPGLILEYRAVSKLLGTYVEALRDQADPQTSRIHGLFNQCVTSTGRLSSSEPNLQNIPVRKPIGKEIRRAFKASDGCCLIGADYSQIELRVMAHFSKDPIMLDAFRNDEDVHSRTASAIFGVPMDQVTKLQRSTAKTINFGILYGMGAQKLAREINVTTAEAKSFISRFREQFSSLDVFFKSLVAQAEAKGYVTTLLKRRRYIPDIHSEKPMLRSFAERTAINTPIQGTASDLIKLAMVRLRKALKDHQLQARILIQVHDELILECPETERDRVIELLRACMEGVYPLDVALKVEVKCGKNWADMSPVDYSG